MSREAEAYIADGLFELGIGEVVVCRFKGGGRVEAGFFLLDVFCLGVKNAIYHTFDSEKEFREEFLSVSATSLQPGPYGRKLVEGAVRYAESLGISPHSDYKKAARVFGGINPADCGEKFVFGRKGRPLLVQTPDDDEEKFERINTMLEIRLGKDGFDCQFADFDDDESEINVYALDSRADDEEPIPELEDFAADFLREHDEEWDDVIYGGAAYAHIAAAFLNSARELHQAAQSKLEALPIGTVLNYLSIVWNLRNLPDEERAPALEVYPENERAALRKAVESLPEIESHFMVLDHRLLHADEPDRERLLILCEPV
jgi:hypothetical protein